MSHARSPTVRTRAWLAALLLAALAISFPAAGDAKKKKKANPCAKRKAEKTGCVLKGAEYSVSTPTADYVFRVGSFALPVKATLTIAYHDDACGQIRTFDLVASKSPKIGSILALSRRLTLEEGTYNASAKVKLAAKTATLIGVAAAVPAGTGPGAAPCDLTWAATLKRVG